MTDKITKAKAGDLIPDIDNANRHTPRGEDMVQRSISKHGFRFAGTLDKENRIVHGNNRHEQAGTIGLDDVVIVEADPNKQYYLKFNDLDLADTENPARELTYLANRTAQVSINFSPEQLAVDIEAGIDLNGMFFEDEMDEILAELVKDEPPEEPPDPQVNKAEELQKEWGTEVGQIWALGDHRVACGDCTDRDVVEGVMRGGMANLFLTDPPYGVSYADKNAFLNTLAKGNAVQKRIENDHQSMDDMKALWYQAAKNACDFSNDTASYYWFACQGGDQMMMMMTMMIGDAGWKVRHELIWVKNNHVLGRSDYQYKHEPILYGWKRKGTHKWFGGFQTSVLEFDKPTKSNLHPTTKPVELVEFLIKNSTQVKDTVYDPFLGSGTTLIAAHQLKRRCYGIELDPGYVAVTLQRFLDLTNIQPDLISG